jgi:hypothetical protein
MVAISGAFVLIAAAIAGFRLMWLARASNKRLKQPPEFAQISQKLSKPDR